MASINISKIEEDDVQFVFKVEISDDGSKTQHTVTLQKKDHHRLTNNAVEPSEFVRASFDFLLEREAKESILSRFDIMDITKYFPEYEAEINNRLT